MFVSHSCQPPLQASLLAQTHLFSHIARGTCRSPGVLLAAMEWSPGADTAWVSGGSAQHCSFYTLPLYSSEPCSVLYAAVLFGRASSPSHDFCDFLLQHLALHPLTLQVHAVLLSAHVETIPSIFTQHYFPTGLLASEAEVGHHPHQQVLMGQNPNLCQDQGDFGFR